jgi:hypothetical protein
VRIVTADARTNSPFFGMVRVLVGMTTRASAIRAAPDVVRGVAVGAITMTGGVSRAEHGKVFVAGTTPDRLLLAELMRLVATDARYVATFEQGRRWHHGLCLLVARHAGGQGLRARRVLLLMTSRANLIGRLAAQGMGGLDVLMAALARPRLGRGVLVRPVAIEALAGIVNSYGGREPLACAVAVRAIARLMRVRQLVLG